MRIMQNSRVRPLARSPLRPLRSLGLLGVGVLLTVACISFSSALAQNLFVVAPTSDSVTVIDSATDQITNRIPVGTHPVRITMSPDRRTAYISNGQSSTVSVIDTDTLATVATIPVAPNPQEAAVTPDGGRLFLVHQLTAEISVIDTASNQVIRTIGISGRANDVLLTFDGRFAYFADYNVGKVDVVDTATYQVNSITTGSGPRRLAISPKGNRVAVANYLGNSVSVIDTLTQAVVRTIPVGIAPRGIAITPSGDAIYTTDVRGGTASIIDSRTWTVKTLTVGQIPWQVVITDDGTRAFVTNGVPIRCRSSTRRRARSSRQSWWERARSFWRPIQTGRNSTCPTRKIRPSRSLLFRR